MIFRKQGRRRELNVVKDEMGINIASRSPHWRVCSPCLPLPSGFTPFLWPPSSLSRQERGECGGAPCRVVYDEAFLREADAVVIRPTVRRLPRARSPSQLWVLFSVEAPTR